MWPWGHAGLGYLVYAAVRRGRGRPWPPDDASTVALVLGTQFPDLVDKPLAWSLHVLPSGRSLAHSALTATLVAAVVLALGRRYDQRAPTRAFVLGYYTHLLGDVLLPLVQFDADFLRFLLWPLHPPPTYESDPRYVERFVDLTPTTFALFGLAVTALAAGLWVRDGYPGLRWVAKRPRGPTGDD